MPSSSTFAYTNIGAGQEGRPQLQLSNRPKHRQGQQGHLEGRNCNSSWAVRPEADYQAVVMNTDCDHKMYFQISQSCHCDMGWERPGQCRNPTNTNTVRIKNTVRQRNESMHLTLWPGHERICASHGALRRCYKYRSYEDGRAQWHADHALQSGDCQQAPSPAAIIH